MLKNTITEMKNILEEIKSKINGEKEWISELEDRVVEISSIEKNKKE